MRGAFTGEQGASVELAEWRRGDPDRECGCSNMAKEQDLGAQEVVCWYPRAEMEEAELKHRDDTAPQLQPLINTEFLYHGSSEDGTEAVTKAIP